MCEVLLGIIFIFLGIHYLTLVFKLNLNKDIYLIKNRLVDIHKIQFKEKYLIFNIKINILMGVSCIINGLSAIISTILLHNDLIFLLTNILTIFCIFIYLYSLKVKAPKF